MGLQVYEHEKKKHRETDELRREEANLQQQEQRLRQVSTAHSSGTTPLYGLRSNHTPSGNCCMSMVCGVH